MSNLNDQDRENLVAYLDGELEEEAAQALEAKINLDPEARKEVEALKQTWGMLDYLPKPDPPTGFTHRTMERLSLEKMGKAIQTGKMAAHRRGRMLRILGWAAAVLLAAGAGFWAAEEYFDRAKKGPDPEEPLVRHLPVLEKWRQLEKVDDLDFLRALDHPDLFGEDQGF